MLGSRASRLFGRLIVTAMYLFLLAPIIIVFLISFDASSSMSFPPEGFSTQWYRAVIENETFMRGFRVSIITASLVAVLTVLSGVPAAMALVRGRFPGRSVLEGFFLSPLLVPAIVLGLAMLLVLAPVGLVGSVTGIVLAHYAITLPYVIRTVSMALITMDRAAEEAARTLGANPWQTFLRVTLPAITPGVIAGGVIAFIISFDEAVISLFVVSPSVTTLPVEIFNFVQRRTDPSVAALSVMLIAISLLIVVIVERAIGLNKAFQNNR